MGLLGPCTVWLLAESSAYPLIYILISVLLTAFSSLCRKTRVINVCWKVRTSGSYIKVSFLPGVHGRNDFLFSSCLHGLLSCDLFPYYAWFPEHLNLLLTFSFHFVRSAGFALRALDFFSDLVAQKPTNSLSQQIRILHKTNKNIFFSELLAFWKVCSFTVYVLNIGRWHGGDQFDHC